MFFLCARRIVYAPLTRCRALGTIPQPAAATYYAQRATKGGLMLSEATVICPQGHGHAFHLQHHLVFLDAVSLQHLGQDADSDRHQLFVLCFYSGPILRHPAFTPRSRLRRGSPLSRLCTTRGASSSCSPGTLGAPATKVNTPAGHACLCVCPMRTDGFATARWRM